VAFFIPFAFISFGATLLFLGPYICVPRNPQFCSVCKFDLFLRDTCFATIVIWFLFLLALFHVEATFVPEWYIFLFHVSFDFVPPSYKFWPSCSVILQSNVLFPVEVRLYLRLTVLFHMPLQTGFIPCVSRLLKFFNVVSISLTRIYDLFRGR
jgi:hypothetical protein